MAALPPEVLAAVDAKLVDVQEQLRLMPVEKLLEAEELEWSFDLDGRWGMFVEVDTSSRRLAQDEVLLDLAVAVGRLVVRPRLHRPVRVPVRRA